MKYSLLIGLFLIFSSCSSEAWTDDQQDQFKAGCKTEGGSSSYCDCYMNKTMEKYPRYEEAQDVSFEEAIEISLECE